MSIQTQITRIKNAKTSILSAITQKGVSVPSGCMLDAIAPIITNNLLNADNCLSVELEDGTSEHLILETD
jgi:hypothetical protein